MLFKDQEKNIHNGFIKSYLLWLQFLLDNKANNLVRLTVFFPINIKKWKNDRAQICVVTQERFLASKIFFKCASKQFLFLLLKGRKGTLNLV